MSTSFDDLPFAESFCEEGATERLCAALGITSDQVETLRFELVRVPLDDTHLDCLWTERGWDEELAERRDYLDELAANIDHAPEPILAPAAVGDGHTTYHVIDGVQRLNCARHRGRRSMPARAAIPPDRDVDAT